MDTTLYISFERYSDKLTDKHKDLIESAMKEFSGRLREAIIDECSGSNDKTDVTMVQWCCYLIEESEKFLVQLRTEKEIEVKENEPEAKSNLEAF